MVAKENVLGRFLRYVACETTSDPQGKSAPSTPAQMRFAHMLAEELRELGYDNAAVSEFGVVTAFAPATKGCEQCPAVGLIAHMDTSPDASGNNVRPRIVRYEGRPIALDVEQTRLLDAERFPELSRYKGEDLVVTDGTTLLGADDKAGIAAIMGVAAWIAAHPQDPHARICFAFTPDEEIGRGIDHFDIAAFGADFAYTIDGGEIGSFETENFNAASARVNFSGVSVHPGSACGKMVNALRLAMEFISRLPQGCSPETTRGREGFLHPHHLEAGVESARLEILIRDFDRDEFEQKKQLVSNIAREMNCQYGYACCSVEVSNSYFNMREALEKAPAATELARRAYAAAGVPMRQTLIRGGTDGAMLSQRGLPCPNIFTGGMNYHGIYEYLPVKSLEAAERVAIEIARLSAGSQGVP